MEVARWLQSHNRSDLRLCLNRFKLCDWFVSRRIIQRASRSFEQCFWKFEVELNTICFNFFSATDVIVVWTSSRGSLVAEDYTTTNLLWLKHSCKRSLKLPKFFSYFPIILQHFFHNLKISFNILLKIIYILLLWFNKVFRKNY